MGSGCGPVPPEWVPGFGRICFSLETGVGLVPVSSHIPRDGGYSGGIGWDVGGMGISRKIPECGKGGRADVPRLSLSRFPLDGAIVPGMPLLLLPPPAAASQGHLSPFPEFFRDNCGHCHPHLLWVSPREKLSRAWDG